MPWLPKLGEMKLWLEPCKGQHISDAIDGLVRAMGGLIFNGQLIRYELGDDYVYLIHKSSRAVQESARARERREEKEMGEETSMEIMGHQAGLMFVWGGSQLLQVIYDTTNSSKAITYKVYTTNPSQLLLQPIYYIDWMAGPAYERLSLKESVERHFEKDVYPLLVMCLDGR